MMYTDGGQMSTPQHHDTHSLDQECTPDDIRYRVLLALPTETYIPIFAMGVEARRRQCETTVLDHREELSRLVGGNLTRSLAKRYGEHRLIQSRIRISPRTVLYSRWLDFPTAGQAQDFVRKNPKFGIKATQVRVEAEYTMRKGALTNGIAKGRFDLSGVAARSRLHRAREYVGATEEVNRLQEGRQVVATLEKTLAAVPNVILIG
jgi:hypothetical protein